MKHYICLFLLLGVLGCGNKQVTMEGNPEEKKKPSNRPIVVAQPVRKEKDKDKAGKTTQPDKPAAYTFGDLVYALQEDVKARDPKNGGGIVPTRDPRLFRPDQRHEQIRAIIRERYEEEMSLGNLLKLREEICKSNELTVEDLNSRPLTEITDAFGKKDQ